MVRPYSKNYNIIKTYFKRYNVVCEDGFHGMNCSQPCSETFYGPGCRLKCLCNTSTDYCHHVFGCMTSSPRGNLNILQSKQCVS